MASSNEPRGREQWPVCPRCEFGRLGKHCPDTNRCGWFSCDLPCGYVISVPKARSILEPVLERVLYRHRAARRKNRV